MHNGIPVAIAMHKMRPATIAEMLGYQVMLRNMVPFDGNDPSQRQPGKQQGFVDATEWTDVVPAPSTPAHHTDVRPTSSKQKKISRPRHEPPPPIVHENDQNVIDKLRYDSRGDVMNEGQMFRTERGLPYQTPLGSGRLSTTGDDGEPPRAQGPQTPLEQEWQRSSPGLDDPGTRLVRAMPRREGSAASEAARSRTRSPAKSNDAEARLAIYNEVYKDIYTAIDDFDAFRACWAERCETDASNDWSKKKEKKKKE